MTPQTIDVHAHILTEETIRLLQRESPKAAPKLSDVDEQFGTLESLYPGRIDLGLGRAPGTDPVTARALRRDRLMAADQFPQEVQELQSYFRPATPDQAVRAVPGQGLNVPLWLLGSSDFSARFAASAGLPFAFASHFAPDHLHTALELYRRSFQPSDTLDRPYVMVAANVVAAGTDQEATRLFTSAQQSFTNMLRNARGKLPPPIDDIDAYWLPHEKAHASGMLARSFVGSAETIRAVPR